MSHVGGHRHLYNFILLTVLHHIDILHFTLLKGAETQLSFIPESYYDLEKYYNSLFCAQAEQVLMPQLRLLTSIFEQ